MCLLPQCQSYILYPFCDFVIFLISFQIFVILPLLGYLRVCRPVHEELLDVTRRLAEYNNWKELYFNPTYRVVSFSSEATEDGY